MPQIKLEVRQSYAISNASVGALLQIGELSMVPFDIRYWEQDGVPIDMPRLSSELNRTFRKAPIIEQRGGIEVGGRIPVVRFPRWHFCQKCRRMYGNPRPAGRPDEPCFCGQKECVSSRSSLAPMPWLMVCPNGHLDELPWHTLVHRGSTSQKQLTCKNYDQLFFNPPGMVVRYLQVFCGDCKASLNLSALRAPDFLQDFNCRGRQPWLHASEECDAKPSAVGLGDHFVHYPAIVSALDIPPESRRDPRDDIGQLVRQHPDWRRLEEISSLHGRRNPVVEQMISAMSNALGCTASQIEQCLSPDANQATVEVSAPMPVAEGHNLKHDEYEALLTKINDYMEYERFITINRSSEWQAWLSSAASPEDWRPAMTSICDLVGVTRLREVRALRGFTRVNPPGSEDTRLVPPDLEGTSSWLPAAEFFGEGVFFTLDHVMLNRWQNNASVLQRTTMARRGFEAFWAKRLAISEAALPAFVALHTLSHLMIREMAFQCGYPAASLRERIYFSEESDGMAGVLIYLAAGEPGGSLGGLARLSEPTRFSNLLCRCAEAARWCALDPVCAEHEGRGESRLNRAACHACCLLPETSCEFSNLMLDRRLVVADEDEIGLGFLDSIEVD